MTTSLTQNHSPRCCQVRLLFVIPKRSLSSIASLREEDVFTLTCCSHLFFESPVESPAQAQGVSLQSGLPD